MERKASEPFGLYLHIPFCHARCGYCDFVTFTGKEDQRDRYIHALTEEIKLYAPAGISTIFLGGGTPSVLDPEHIDTLFAALHREFSFPASVETTLEANPESLTSEKLLAWRNAGINRLSIGLQAYDDRLLKAMGRLHTVAEFEAAYERARQAGFENMNIDLIYGFPDQTIESWRQTVRLTVALQPEHISLYALKVEEHTPFAAQGVRVDDDFEAAMYTWALEHLPAQGYAQYEISNFARPSKACAHNLIYWRGQDYLGLGVGAVGCVGNVRWENQKNLVPYFKDIDAGLQPRVKQEILDSQTQKFERLMLGLRLREGFKWIEQDPAWVSQRSRLASEGYLEEVQPDTWRVTEPYIGLTNQILLPFLPS